MQSYEPPEGFNATKILAQSKETIEEAQSDACIFQVFNCQSQETSETCRKLFFVQEQSLYSLTHQVIYTLFAKKVDTFICYTAILLKFDKSQKNYMQMSPFSETMLPSLKFGRVETISGKTVWKSVAGSECNLTNWISPKLRRPIHRTSRHLWHDRLSKFLPAGLAHANLEMAKPPEIGLLQGHSSPTTQFSRYAGQTVSP